MQQGGKTVGAVQNLRVTPSAGYQAMGTVPGGPAEYLLNVRKICYTGLYRELNDIVKFSNLHFKG